MRLRRALPRTFPLPLLLLAAAVGSCGIRTDPRPPEDTMPRATTDVRAVAEGGKVRVEWRSPSESIDGKRLGDLTAFVVERRVSGEKFTPIAEVPADTTHRLRPIRDYSYVDEEPAGPGAEYRVVAYTAEGQRGVPGPPAAVTVPAKKQTAEKEPLP